MKKNLEILQRYKLRNTEIRREILSLFLDTDYALSHQYIEKKLEAKFDRVTLYRTLKAFEESGLVHRIANDKETIEYALCKDDCHAENHKHSDNHAHFRCEICQKTYCLDSVGIPDFHIPMGFKAKEFQLLVNGICEKCA
jgi:Fur family transcriptional regulator, ferric uptake regulator